MWVMEGHQLVEVSDTPFVLGDRSVGDPFPQYWHKNSPLGFSGGPTLVVKGPVDFMDCPTRFNVNNGACDPVVSIGNSTSATPYSYLTFGTLGSIRNQGANELRITSALGALSLEHAAFSIVNILNDVKIHNTATVDTNLVVNEDASGGTVLRVESSSDPNFLSVLAGTQQVGIGAGVSPSSTLHVKSAGQGALYIDNDASDAVRFNSNAGANYFNVNNSVTPRLYQFKAPVGIHSNVLDMDETSIDMLSTWATFTAAPMLKMVKTIGPGKFEISGQPIIITETVDATALAISCVPLQIDLTNGPVNGALRGMQITTNQAAAAGTEGIFVRNNYTGTSPSSQYAVNSEAVVSNKLSHATGYRGYGQNTDVTATPAIYAATGVFAFAASGGGALAAGLETTVALSVPNTSRIVAYYNNGHVHGTGGIWYCYAGTPIQAAPVTLNINPAVDLGSVWIEEKLEVVNGGVYIDLVGSKHGFNSADTVPAFWGFADDCSIRWDATDMVINSDNNASGGLMKLAAASNWVAGGGVAPGAMTLNAGMTGVFAGWLTVKDNAGAQRYIPSWF